MHESDNIFYIPIPRICSGRVTSKITKSEIWEVLITESPIGEFKGPIHCNLVYSPGLEGNLKQGDFVKVVVTFMFGGPGYKYDGVASGTQSTILGVFNEKAFLPLKVENPYTEVSDDEIRVVNRRSGAGVVMSDHGSVVIAAGGNVTHTLAPWGFGTNKDSIRAQAQNHQRIIGGNAGYLSRDSFGMYCGSDQNDEATKTSTSDHFINYRRFVQETRSVKNWVSTCEGFFAPWVGPNNNMQSMGRAKNVLFNKIVNKGSTRLTIECGEEDDNFVQIRVDEVVVGEQSMSSAPGASPAKLKNKFKMTVSEKGALNISAAGTGTPGSAVHGFSMTVSENGDLNIYSKGKITMSHGEKDVDNNSIVLDPKKGIDILGTNGVRVNGKEVLLAPYLDWMDQNKQALCQVTMIGGPAPIHPGAMPNFALGVQKFGKDGGFTSKGKGATAGGVIKNSDKFNSV